MSLEKYGMVTEESMSDYDFTKKAAYYDAEGHGIADEGNKHKLKKPSPILDPWTEKPAKIAEQYEPTRSYTAEQIKKRWPNG